MLKMKRFVFLFCRSILKILSVQCMRSWILKKRIRISCSNAFAQHYFLHSHRDRASFPDIISYFFDLFAYLRHLFFDQQDELAFANISPPPLPHYIRCLLLFHDLFLFLVLLCSTSWTFPLSSSPLILSLSSISLSLSDWVRTDEKDIN